MKKIISTLIIINIFINLTAQKPENTNKTFYITTNALSPLAGLNKSSSIANALIPLFSNLEYGITLSGGYFKNYHSIETRISYGKSNTYSVIPQIQLGYNYFIIDYLKHNNSGWYVGGFARYWLYQNINTDAGMHNITSNVTLGYVNKKHRFIYDIRLNQPLTIYSISSISNTKPSFETNFSPMPKFSPVLPFLSFNIGYQFY